MSRWHKWRRRLLQDQQLDKELRFHLDQHVSDLIARGHDPAEAWRQARISLGGLEQVKEECRDARGTRWLRDFFQDVRYAVRLLRQKPGFAAVTLLTLGLGTGAATVMFTVVDGVLLKPLPYAAPDRLVRVYGHTNTWNVGLFGDQNLAYLDFRDCQRQSATVSMAGWLWNTATLSEPGEADHVVHVGASANLFSLLGVRLDQGRVFLSDEDRPGGAPVAILSYDLARRRFGGTTTALGMTLVLDGQHYTVVGVAPARFRLDGDDVDVYTPIGQDPTPLLQRRGPHPIGVLGRLQPRVTLTEARTELAGIGRRLAGQYPDTNNGRTFIANPLRPDVGDVGSTLWLLLGAVTLVLLIACANIASLLLARAVSRERELAMRVALGAGRARLVRQCLTESAVLGLGGGALGVVLASVGLHPFVLLWPGSLPRAEEVQVDWRVLLFALAVSLASGVLFGLAPALRAPARDVERTLRAGARTMTGSVRRLHGAFVVSEIALAMVLLACAAMLGRTLLRLSSLDPGVEVQGVLTARTALSPGKLSDPAAAREAWRDLLDRVRKVPGVEAVSMVDTVPMRRGSNPIGYRISAAAVPDNQQPIVLANSVSADYLKVTGIPLRKGRFLTDQDRSDSQSIAVIDDVMAQQAFGGHDPIGKQLWINLGTDPVTVVGVVGHVRYWGLAGDDQSQVRAQLYYPFAQVPDRLVRRWSELMSIAVRTGGDPMSAVAPLRRAIRRDSNDQVIYEIRTLEELASASLAPQRFLLLLFGGFAGLALLLACIGIYGVLAYLTSERIPEMAMRMVLGASSGRVMWLVLQESLGMIGLGAAVGLAGTYAAGRVLERLVEGVLPTGPSTVVMTILLLTLAALLASVLPARRASRVDPARVLR